MRSLASSSPPPTPPSVYFLGIPVDAVTNGQMFTMVDEWLRNKDQRSHHIACVNVNCVILAQDNERLRHIYSGADIVGADGMPFVRWIRNVHHMPCDRLAAPDILLELARRAKDTGYTFYLFGGHPDVAKRMKENLLTQFPYLKIVGCYSPPFRPMTQEEDEKICEEINALRPDFILVGLGTPKQDYWIEDHLERIRGSVMIASGATFDFFGGRIKMAPRFVRLSGFEWLYRLLSKDFTRLWKRYTVFNIIFLWGFLKQLLGFRPKTATRWRRGNG